jgi:hypothetical protein
MSHSPIITAMPNLPPDPRPLEPPDEGCGLYESPPDDSLEFWEDDDELFQAICGGCADG